MLDAVACCCSPIVSFTQFYFFFLEWLKRNNLPILLSNHLAILFSQSGLGLRILIALWHLTGEKGKKNVFCNLC